MLQLYALYTQCASMKKMQTKIKDCGLSLSPSRSQSKPIGWAHNMLLVTIKTMHTKKLYVTQIIIILTILLAEEKKTNEELLSSFILVARIEMRTWEGRHKNLLLCKNEMEKSRMHAFLVVHLHHYMRASNNKHQAIYCRFHTRNKKKRRKKEFNKVHEIYDSIRTYNVSNIFCHKYILLLGNQLFLLNWKVHRFGIYA